MKYCVHCGAEIKDEALICPKCGCPTPKYKMDHKKMPIEAMYIVLGISLLIILITAILGTFPQSGELEIENISYSAIFSFIAIIALTAVIITTIINVKDDNYKISMSVFIFIGVLFFVGFCVACKQLSIIIQNINDLPKTASAIVKKTYETSRNREVFAMIGYLLAATTSMMLGISGLLGKLTTITEMKKAEQGPIKVEA